ncbi:MAG: DUF4296 domain-containing protein [Bacteroidales bacterium]|jgi:hypothetical protein
MMTSKRIRNSMKGIFILASAMLLILSGSCSGRRSKAGHKDIIPEKKLITILTEAHIADGLLVIPDIRREYSNLDNLAIYREIFEKHGYNEEIMEKTMRFYFMKRPKKLIKIYDKVLSRLSEMEARIEQLASQDGVNSTLNLWQGQHFYTLHGQKDSDTAWFEFPVRLQGKYTISFTLTLYPDDQTADPQCGIFSTSADTDSTDMKDYYKSLPFLKDGLPHYYSITKTISGTPPFMLKGWFINYENQHPSSLKHMSVNNIALFRNLSQ